jgi:transposase
MAGKLPMGQKDLLRAKILEMVKEEKMSLREASVRLKVSYRQAKRLYSRYKAEGDRGLIHRTQGRASPRKMAEEMRQRIVETYKESYLGFGPTFAAEKLKEREGLAVGRETLRRVLMEEGVWKRKKRRRAYHSRRTPRERFGELVQFDGSHHDWFEGRREKCCLMNMVDDATGTTMSFLCEQETTESAMKLLWMWIERYGIPQAVYCDRKNAFVLDREPTITEQLEGITPKSPFQKACERLGIEVIIAYSPEAKGRVERNHGVYQDRFVKELRLAGISTIDEANGFLREVYLPEINLRFAKIPAQPEDAHVPLLDGADLRDIFCFETQRVVSRDNMIQFEKRLFRIPENLSSRPLPGKSVTIRKWLDDSLHFMWKNHPLFVEEYALPQKNKEVSGKKSA